MKVGGPNDQQPLITPVSPTEGTGLSGDRHKSPGERKDEIEEQKASFTSRFTAEDAIDLRGLSQEDAKKLAEHPAFKGWEASNPYTGAMPAPLRELQETLARVAAASALEPSDPIRLESAGEAIAAAIQVAGQRPANDVHNLAKLQGEAREIGAKLATERGQGK